jgi:hypothetical protein
VNELLNLSFDFVTDEDVKRILLRLQEEAVKSFEVGSYLGTIVACGGAAEGVLTWALGTRGEQAQASKHAQKDRQGKPMPLREWYLPSLILVALDCDLLGRTASDASWALKEFRNLIHPYRLLNQSARPDEALALSSAAALKEICRSVSGRLSN